jgi:putative oxidoreductase
VNPLYPQAARSHPLRTGILPPSQGREPGGCRSRYLNPIQWKEKTMKIVTMIARYLLGLVFLVFGLNKFFNFIPSGPMPSGAAGQFMGALFSTHYIMAVGAFEVVPGILLLINRYVPLALCLLAPVIVNILLVGTLMTHAALPSGIMVAILWFLVYRRVRSAFSGLYQMKAAD